MGLLLKYQTPVLNCKHPQYATNLNPTSSLHNIAPQLRDDLPTSHINTILPRNHEMTLDQPITPLANLINTMQNAILTHDTAEYSKAQSAPKPPAPPAHPVQDSHTAPY